MIEFFEELWLQITELWAQFVTSIPLWINTALEALKAVGIVGILSFIAFKVVPVLKKSNKPLLALVQLLFAEITGLKKQIADRENREQTVDQLFTEYMTLSCEVNANSRTLSPETKEKYVALAKAFTATGNVKAGDALMKVVEDGKVTDQEVLDVAREVPIVKEVLDMTPTQVLETADALRESLAQRG